MRNKAYKSHILTKKSQKRKRNLRKATVVDSTNVKSVKEITALFIRKNREDEQEEFEKWQELKAVFKRKEKT